MEILDPVSGAVNTGTNPELISLADFFDGPPAPVQLGPAIPRLFADAVSPRLKYPHINLDTGHGAVVMRLAGAKSKHPGSVTVTSEGGYDFSVFYGRITTTGELQSKPAMTAEIVELLRRFSDDPITVACECGAITGHCCFCGLPLSDIRSVAHGYGETCAKAWNLPWRVNRGLLKITGSLYGYAWSAVSGAEIPA